MPSNEIMINGNIKYEVPDSYMGPLDAYLEMVKEHITFVQADVVPERVDVVLGGPVIPDEDEDPVPVQNDSFAQRLANESLHMVCELLDTLEPVLLPDDGTTPDAREASPIVETWLAIHGHLGKLVKRVDL